MLLKYIVSENISLHLYISFQTFWLKQIDTNIYIIITVGSASVSVV